LRLDVSAETRLCAVIGSPVAHSLSPLIHNAAFEALGLNFVYLGFQVDDVEACLSGMRAMSGFVGMSVTIPHKRSVMSHLDSISSLAEKIGSVNTVSKVDGKLEGTSTDGLGTLRAFKSAGIDISGKDVLFLGSGGAVRAVAFAVADEGCARSVKILGRTRANVDSLVNDIAAKTRVRVSGGNFDSDLVAAMAEHEVIIQGTPLGLEPEMAELTVVPAELWCAEHVAFDMVYRPLETRFLREAGAAGCRVITGIEMLVHQAALQFDIWTGRDAPFDVMRSAAIDRLYRV